VAGQQVLVAQVGEAAPVWPDIDSAKVGELCVVRLPAAWT